MPVYNGERYLQESIESILNQTFKDFEFLLVNDGSTDESPNILSNYARRYSNIRIITNPTNLGIAKATNSGINLARGVYIALMDQDDISVPERLERQVKFLDDNPGISVVGGNTVNFDNEGNFHKRNSLLDTPGLIRWALLFRNQIQNPTVLIRREIFSEHGFAYEDYMPAQDYHMWFQLSDRFRFANLQDILAYHRVHSTNATSVFSNQSTPGILKMKVEFVEKHLNLQISTNTAIALSHPHNVSETRTAVILCGLIMRWLRVNLKSTTISEKKYIKKKTAQMIRSMWRSTGKNIRLFPFVAQSIILHNRYTCK